MLRKLERGSLWEDVMIAEYVAASSNSVPGMGIDMGARCAL